MHPFWPDRSPHFLKCRLAVRPFLRTRPQGSLAQTSPTQAAAPALAQAPAQAPAQTLAQQTPAHAPASGSAPIVVGLSGGPDSLALVAACCAEGARVHAVIVDHQLQECSAEVAQEARRQAEALGATASVVTVSVPRDGSLEAQARAARYRALLNAVPPAHSAAHSAADIPAEVFIAHTLDDQAETYLLGGLRGNPGGMAVREGRIVRPFLTVRRADTEGACQELGLTPWQDPQNQDPGFLRVAIRTQVLPTMASSLGHDPAPALARAATRCAENRQAVATVTESLFPPGPLDVPGSLDVETLAAQPRAVRTCAVERFLRAAGAPVNRQILTQVENLVMQWHGQAAVSLGSFLEVQRVNGKLIVSDRAAPEE